MQVLDDRFIALSFDQLPGWAEDDHAVAFHAFLNSCRAGVLGKPVTGALPCEQALALGPDSPGDAAREFFETHFTPYALTESDVSGFVTGYYEPEVAGAREPSARFSVPAYGVPDDLVPLSSDIYRAQYNDRVTARRNCGYELEDYYTRAEIEAGALEGRGLELLYLDDPIELFYMQVQGSGLVHLDDGSTVRLTYAGKNGHPYTSIGKLLVEGREIAPKAIDMERVKAWLRADPLRGRALMQQNESYIFFRELSEEEGRDGPLGVGGVPLTPGRSMAIDPAYLPLGTPIYVVADNLFTSGQRHFSRLMIGQDAGSAIGGIERGDIFWGTGEIAGMFAGTTRHLAVFTVLLPKP